MIFGSICGRLSSTRSIRLGNVWNFVKIDGTQELLGQSKTLVRAFIQLRKVGNHDR